jgi:fumarylpyruvate hydrolase
MAIRAGDDKPLLPAGPACGTSRSMSLLFDLPANPSVPVLGEAARFPVRRIFCVGRNYAAHAKEMGFSPDKDAPFFFTKSPWALCESGATIPYPLGTANCHYEMELVLAIGAPAFRMAKDDALAAVYGYACGLDMTRRDLQNAAKDKGYPWDTGKDFENAAVIAAITPAGTFGQPEAQPIALAQNGATKQDASLAEMIWSVPELIADLSRMYPLAPGDLIYTGTPVGVGPIAPGDVLEGSVEGLEPVHLTIGAA